MNVFKFYNEVGWNKRKKHTKDAELFEDLREVAHEYVTHCRKKINNHIAKKGSHILDFASGPIQYKEYLEYSKNFTTRHCVDFSRDAINEAKKKLGRKGKYYCYDFEKIKFKKNFFDTIISLHTIYHINNRKQVATVKKLIYISKKNAPIVIIYSNPDTIINKVKNILLIKKEKNPNDLYFFCHKNKWWNQFLNLADIKLYPWRSFSSQHQKIFFPNNIIGKLMFKILMNLEKKFPDFFTKHFQYLMIVIRKY